MTKAKQLCLSDLLTYQADNGEIFLNDKRMIISNADAMGLLRKDLIAALGRERAKRFLLRHGWNSGTNDAKNIKEKFKWKDEVESILAGAKMHTIFGNVFSEVTKIDVNHTEGTCLIEGYWYNSFEAEQHLEHFPLHHEPVCYNLVGYASGYASEIVGRKMVIKEVECVGKGDKHCRFIGKTIEEWGDEIPEELINFEEDNMADELDCAYQRIEKQKEVLNLGLKVNQELTQIVLEGKGLDTITKTLGESLVCSVTIETQNFELLSSFGKMSKYPLYSLKALMKSSNLQQKQREMLNRLIDDRRTIELDLSDSINPMERRLITPIILRDQIYGFLSLINNEGFGETEKAALERAATVCAVSIYIERNTIETEQRMKGKLLDELLHKDVDVSVISNQLMYLGYHLTFPHHIFLFQLESTKEQFSKKDEDLRTVLRNKLINLFTTQLQQAGYHCLISEKLDQVYTTVPLKFIEQQGFSPKQFGEYLLRLIGDCPSNIKVSLGISNICKDLKSFYQGYQESIKAIEVANIKRKSEQVILYSELGHLGLLLNARHPEELEVFANQQLGELYEYDKKNDAELMKTLYFYVENEHNLHKTARIMNISISGMRYRLRRIKELLDMDLVNSSKRFEIQLALEIFLITGNLLI